MQYFRSENVLDMQTIEPETQKSNFEILIQLKITISNKQYYTRQTEMQHSSTWDTLMCL